MKQNDKTPKMTKEERVLFNLVNQIRTKVFKGQKLNPYEEGLLNELSRQEDKKVKALYKESWNIKLYHTYLYNESSKRYFLLKGYGKQPEEKFYWIREEITKRHIDAMFNKKEPEEEYTIFKSKKIEIEVNIKTLIVKLITKRETFTRPYTLAELPLFKNIAAQIKI
jgi:hypothetical protein